MKQEFIILREPLRSNSSPHSSEDEAAFPTIEIEELSFDELAAIRERSDVLAVTANMPVSLTSSFPADLPDSGIPAKGAQTWGIEAMGAPETSLSGVGMVAAVLDTGIDRNHPAFEGISIREADFTGEGNGDGHGHGTHCAATVFGGSVAGTQVGVAPGVDYALVGKVLDEDGKGDMWGVIQGMRWAAENGANVVSLALRLRFTTYVEELVESGYPADVATAFALEAYHTSVEFLEKFVAILRLGSEALVIVAAAGDTNRRFENLAWDRLVEAPASIPGIISVGALEDTAEGYSIAPFSNSGPTGVAPGVGILSALAGSVKLAEMEGTGMAASHAAGAALLWGEFLAEWEDLTSFTLEVKMTRSGNKALLKPGLRDLDVGGGLLQAPLEESERNLDPGDEVLQDRDEVTYETLPTNRNDLLTFDQHPVIRRIREELYRKKYGNPFREDDC